MLEHVETCFGQEGTSCSLSMMSFISDIFCYLYQLSVRAFLLPFSSSVIGDETSI